MSGSAVVIGSVHMDLIARADSLPGRGESITGGVFSMAPGGKGGNQAVQLALNGVATTMLTRVGNDPFGQSLVAALHRKGVKTDRIVVDPILATGASTVFADANDYASIIAPGAAGQLSRTDLDAARGAIAGADLVLIQWELPTTFIADAIEYCSGLGKKIVFNASPVAGTAASFSNEHWSAIEWLVVNRVEAIRLAGVDDDGRSDVAQIAGFLRAKLGVSNVVVTLGREGSFWIGASGESFQPAMPSTVVDAVGAGDAFLGTLVAGLIDGIAIEDALRRAAAAGALAVRRSGAYDAPAQRRKAMGMGIISVALTRVTPRSRFSQGKRLKEIWVTIAAALSAKSKYCTGSKPVKYISIVSMR